MQSRTAIYLCTYLGRRRLFHECLPLTHGVERVVDEAHVDVDGVHAGDAVLNTDPVSAKVVAVQPLQSGLGVLGRLKLDQAPVLYHPVFDRDLEKIKTGKM